MADEAKQITDLEEATSVANTDYLAVSQSGKTELTKASVATLSSAVAETLSEGALAELEYATSQGKNAIATALTNKGVATTASETLIQMADKINNLSVDDSKEYINTVLGTANSTWDNTAYFVLRQLPSTGDFLLYTSDMLYYVPKNIYTNIEAMVNAASFSINVGSPLTSQSGWLNFSMDESKVLVRIDATNFKVYNMSETSFTLLHDTFTVSGAYTSYYSQCAVSNDGTFIVWGRTANAFSVYHISTGTTTDIPNSASVYGGLVCISPTNIYIIPAGTSSTSNSMYLYKTTYTMSDTGEFSGTTQNTQLPIPSSSYISAISINFVIIEKTDIYITWDTFSSSGYYNEFEGLHYFQKYIAPADTIGTYCSIQLFIHPCNNTMSAIGTMDIIKLRSTFWTRQSDSTLKCIMPGLGSRYLIYNPTQNTLTLSEDNNNIIVCGSYLDYGDALVLDNCLIDLGGATNQSTGKATKTFELYQWTDDEKLVGMCKNINGLKTYYWPNTINLSTVNAGYFNRETTITPAVPDEGEDAGEEETPGEGGSDPVTYYTWLKGTKPRGLPSTLYSKKSDGLPTLGSGFINLYTDTGCASPAKVGGIYYGVKRNNTDDGYIIQNMAGTGESWAITLEGETPIVAYKAAYLMSTWDTVYVKEDVPAGVSYSDGVQAYRDASCTVEFKIGNGSPIRLYTTQFHIGPYNDGGYYTNKVVASANGADYTAFEIDPTKTAIACKVEYQTPGVNAPRVGYMKEIPDPDGEASQSVYDETSFTTPQLYSCYCYNRNRWLMDTSNQGSGPTYDEEAILTAVYE